MLPRALGTISEGGLEMSGLCALHYSNIHLRLRPATNKRKSAMPISLLCLNTHGTGDQFSELSFNTADSILKDASLGQLHGG